MIDILMLTATALGLIGIVYSVMNQRDLNKREAEALKIKIEQNRKNINTEIEKYNDDEFAKNYTHDEKLILKIFVLIKKLLENK